MTQWPPNKGLWTGLTDALGRTRAHLAGMRCIASWEELRSRLGEPETILCLGNGPSSEAAGVENERFDCLFRVNWIWNERSIHRDPDVVFTADFDAPFEMPIICFPSRGDANRILASYLRRGVGAHTEYLVFAELSASAMGRTWSHQPTNGALMIEAAVLLRPRRLIIAGIDLYLHPHGKYPGGTDAPNRYDDIHHREVDLAVIRTALNQFGGEATILSEQLRSALA